MNNVLGGVLAGIFIGALTVEILRRRKKLRLARKFRKATNRALDQIAGVFK